MAITGFHHLGIEVADLGTCERFYTRHFGFVRVYAYTSKNTAGLRTVFLQKNGLTLELLERPENRGRPGAGAGYFHLALESDDPKAEFERLKLEGLDPAVPRVTGDGYLETSVRDPEGNLIEIGRRVGPEPGLDF